MGAAIGAVLPLGLAVSMSPIPVVALVLLLFTPRARRDGVAMIIGGGLVVLAGLQWRRQARQAERAAALPTWMHALDGFGPARALGLALLFSVVNPESLLLIVSTAAVIVQVAVTPAQEAVAFVILGTLGPAIPLGIYLVLGDRAEPLLSRLRLWLARHNSAIVAVLLLVIGMALLGGGISDFSTTAA